jgi:hypothetical protein
MWQTVFGFGLVLATVGGLLAWQAGLLGTIAPGQAPSTCTLAGSAVSITVQGPGAQAQCGSFIGRITNGGSWYVYEGGQPPQGAVICQVSRSGAL